MCFWCGMIQLFVHVTCSTKSTLGSSDKFHNLRKEKSANTSQRKQKFEQFCGHEISERGITFDNFWVQMDATKGKKQWPTLAVLSKTKCSGSKRSKRARTHSKKHTVHEYKISNRRLQHFWQKHHKRNTMNTLGWKKILVSHSCERERKCIACKWIHAHLAVFNWYVLEVNKYHLTFTLPQPWALIMQQKRTHFVVRKKKIGTKKTKWVQQKLHTKNWSKKNGTQQNLVTGDANISRSSGKVARNVRTFPNFCQLSDGIEPIFQQLKVRTIAQIHCFKKQENKSVA